MVLAIENHYAFYGRTFSALLSTGQAAGATPEISFTVEEIAFDRVDWVDLRTRAESSRNLNPLWAEDLLANGMQRISTCLSLREKAHEVQLRALAVALDAVHGRDAALNTLDLQALTEEVDAADTTAAQNLRLALRGAIEKPFEVKADLAEAPGHGSNYKERFFALRDLYRENISQGYMRLVAAARGLAELYDFNEPLPAPSNSGFLDALAIWTRRATDHLELEIEKRAVREVVISLSAEGTASVTPTALFTKAQFDNEFAAAGSGSFVLPLDQALLDAHRIQRPLLRELSVIVDIPQTDGRQNALRFWSVTVTPPASSLNGEDPTFVCIAESTGNRNPTASAIRSEVHNRNLIGQWTIQVPKISTAGEALTPANIFLKFKISSIRPATPVF